MDSFLTRSAKRLEQALGVPRPWELTPATSIGYQMAAGEGSIGERARKGTAQFIGRYATNIKEPSGYNLPQLNFSNYGKLLKSVATDQPKWLKGDDVSQSMSARDILYREMFDLPSRSTKEAMVKKGEKQYQFTPENIAHQQWIKDTMRLKSQGAMAHHDVLGGVYLEPKPDGGARFSDVWDIISSVEETSSSPDLSLRLRQLITPILRPATVSGEVPAPSKFSGFPTSHPFVKNPDGSQSNVKLSSWDIDGKTYVIPTMVGGKELKGKAAVKVAMDYGLDKYPSFSDSKSAEQWIDKYHGKIGEDGKIVE